jgi:hypothetical protein
MRREAERRNVRREGVAVREVANSVRLLKSAGNIDYLLGVVMLGPGD